MLGSSFFKVLAQTPTPNFCGFDELLSNSISTPTGLSNYAKFVNQYRSNKQCDTIMPPSIQIIEIPCVVHQFYENMNDTFDYQFIKSYIELTNNYLNKTNIIIKLKLVEDICGSSKGFFRRKVAEKYSKFYWSDLDSNLTQLSTLNPKLFLNIWIAKTLPKNIAGYASFPGNTGPNDGIHLWENSVRNYMVESSLLAHELGHYLGLYHVFTHGCHDPLDFLEGDEVCDTYPCKIPTQSTLSACDEVTLRQYQCTDLLDPSRYTYPWENIMGYTACQNEFTKGQIKRMYNVLNTSGNSGRKDIVDNGIALNQAISIAPITTNFVISSNTFAVGKIITVKGDVIVKKNGSLTIDEDIILNFQSDAKLVIEKGAVVYLNGTLSTECGRKWKGVEVCGNGRIGKLGGFPAVQDNANVGILYCKKGSTIENAQIAAQLYGSSGRGGVVYGTEANFINNNQSIIFAPYKRVAVLTSGSMPLLPYRSGIDKCNFEINDKFLYAFDSKLQIDENDRFKDFISLKGVKGIVIKSTNFIVKDQKVNVKLEHGGFGINANDASVIVDSTVFENLSFGIKSAKSLFNMPFYVNHSVFNNCSYGISNTGVDESLVENCTFNLGFKKKWLLNEEQFGIHFAGLMDVFTIRKNFFIPYKPKNIKEYSQVITDIGTYFTGTGPSSEAIVTGNFYENCFTSAQNMMLFNSPNSMSGTSGIKYYCNTFNSIIYDIYVDNDNQIYKEQGQLDNTNPNNPKFNSAGNIFTDAIDIRMSPSSPVLYFYANKNSNQYPDLLEDWDKLWKLPSDDQRILALEGTCPYKKITLVDQALEDLKAEYTEEDLLWQTAKIALLNIDVNDKPAYRQGLITVGYHRAKMESLAAEVLERYKNSTNTEYQSDSLIVWWKKIATPSADIQIVHEHIARGNFSVAHQVLATISQRHQLSVGDTEDFRRYGLLIDYLKENIVDNSSEETLNYIKNNFVDNNVYAQSRCLAENILSYHGLFFIPDYEAPEKGAFGKFSSSSYDNKSTSVDVLPNPAKDFTTFHWNSDKITGKNLLLFISDATGKQLLSNTVAKENSNYEWNTSNLSEGIYFYQILSDNGLTLQSGKIIVQK